MQIILLNIHFLFNYNIISSINIFNFNQIIKIYTYNNNIY